MSVSADGIVDPHAADEPVVAVAGKPAGSEPEFSVTEDKNQVTHGGHKYIREEALTAERARSAGYVKTLQTLEPLMPEFEQFLEQKRNGRQATVDRATRTGPSGDGEGDDYTDDELTGYAITRGYYDEANKPDLKRAKNDLDIMTAIADRRANRAVAPVAKGTVADRARTNASRAMTQTFVDGEPIADQKYIQAAMDSLPDELKADENTANLALVVAAGLQALDDRRTGRARTRGRSSEPVFREGPSGRRVVRGEEDMDALDRAAARARGKTPEQWMKMKNSVGDSGLTGTVLEDYN